MGTNRAVIQQALSTLLSGMPAMVLDLGSGVIGIKKLVKNAGI